MNCFILDFQVLGISRTVAQLPDLPLNPSLNFIYVTTSGLFCSSYVNSGFVPREVFDHLTHHIEQPAA